VLQQQAAVTRVGGNRRLERGVKRPAVLSRIPAHRAARSSVRYYAILPPAALMKIRRTTPPDIRRQGSADAERREIPDSCRHQVIAHDRGSGRGAGLGGGGALQESSEARNGSSDEVAAVLHAQTPSCRAVEHACATFSRSRLSRLPQKGRTLSVIRRLRYFGAAGGVQRCAISAASRPDMLR